MEIGLDLDNTIINYEYSFAAAVKYLELDLPENIKSKNQIRNSIRSKKNGEQIWQQIQGLAYGRFAQSHAKLFHGVNRFLLRCKENGNNVTIVSHKTEYGHFDENKTPLRKVATEFLEEQGLLKIENKLIDKIIYLDTYEEKIKCITEKNFNWYVDDLLEIIENLQGIPKLNLLLFQHMQNSNLDNYKSKDSYTIISEWNQIDTLINGEWKVNEIEKISAKLLKSNVKKSRKISNGGNSCVFKVTLANDTNVCVKIYPIDQSFDRLNSEFNANKSLFTLGQNYTPKPIVKDTNLGIALYEWINGKPIEVITNIEITYALKFIEYLNSNKKSSLFSNVGLASSACLSGGDIVKQIKYRIEKFEKPRKKFSELDKFIEKSFTPQLKKTIEIAELSWPKESKFEIPIIRSEQTISPSDFGFHNAIKRPNGNLAFIDFEYFGWDDPAKLISDFIFHQGMTLSDEQKLFWIKDSLKIYGLNCQRRFASCAPLYGLVWCLIILNDFREEVWNRRITADNSKINKKKYILSKKIDLAYNLLHNLSFSYADLFKEVSKK